MTTAPNQQSIHRWRSENNSFYEFFFSLFLSSSLSHSLIHTRFLSCTYFFCSQVVFLLSCTLYIIFPFSEEKFFFHIWPPLLLFSLAIHKTDMPIYLYKMLQIIYERFFMACLHGLEVAKLLPLSIFLDY